MQDISVLFQLLYKRPEFGIFFIFYYYFFIYLLVCFPIFTLTLPLLLSNAHLKLFQKMLVIK